MKQYRFFAALALVGFVSACGTVDIASRNATIDQTSPTMMLRAMPDAIIAPSLRIAKINVSVPQTLKVSEANRYYPNSDIVWRGDPIGDRHAQIKAIFEAALNKTQAEGDVPAELDVEVMRFHALTEKARYMTGGVHSITFRLTVRDPATGLPMATPHIIQADLDGFGGQQAIEAERVGQTQKVRITDHLSEVFRQELIKPGGYRNTHLGVLQTLTQL